MACNGDCQAQWAKAWKYPIDISKGAAASRADRRGEKNHGRR
jgi:hypothetical protein